MGTLNIPALTGWESFTFLQQQEGKVEHFSGDGIKKNIVLRQWD
jgi:hypothetical protein